jgi:hypothetical protein
VDEICSTWTFELSHGSKSEARSNSMSAISPVISTRPSEEEAVP